MDHRYHTLTAIYTIVKQSSHPSSYLLRPREIILRLMDDWSTIQAHLKELEKEKLVVTQQLDTLVINITEEGIEKAIAVGRTAPA
jgi:hypothetical protein